MILTDAELDHVAGLLSLRETHPLPLHCTQRVFDWIFESNHIFEALVTSGRFCWRGIGDRHREQCRDSGLSFEAMLVDGKVPTYVKSRPANFAGSTIACKIIDDASGSSMIYVPAIKRITEEFLAAASECDCLFFDGSFWSDDEMERRGVGTRTALAMGHVPIDGPAGSLARLSQLRTRKVYTHVNNTNPILDEDSSERHAIERAGWEVAEDGMDFTV